MPNAMAHIDLSRQADLMPIAPATADFMARVAQGMADDLLATMVLARDCPLLLAPAMTAKCGKTPQRNVMAQLLLDGVQILGQPTVSRPAVRSGPVACWSRKRF